jgi:anthranilate phosphoribosyltransferase
MSGSTIPIGGTPTTPREPTDLATLTATVASRRDLTPAQVESAAAALAGTDCTDEAKAAFLAALADKGETPEEVAAFAAAFRQRAVDPGVSAWSDRAIDIVGTGGDHAGGFNVSSLVVLVLASAGVIVMKHGNRGITSKCGSADLLAALGVKLDASPELQRRALDELGYCFFFAPAYHPAFKHIAPVRKTLAAAGRRTVFNILGPLINPGRPAHILLGVYSETWVERLADVLDLLGTPAGLVGHGALGADRGIDELTTATPNRVRGVGRLREVRTTWRAEEFGLPESPFEDLRGGDLPCNLELVQAVLDGRGPRGLVDTIVLNTAVGLWIVGRATSIADGVAPARELLLGGAVRARVAATREFFSDVANLS